MMGVFASDTHRQAGENRCKRVSRGASWRAPLRRARRRIASTVARAARTARIIDATLRFARGHAAETAERLFELNRELRDAQKMLQRALHSVGECVCLV